jgi:hypothetical protein
MTGRPSTYDLKTDTGLSKPALPPLTLPNNLVHIAKGAKKDLPELSNHQIDGVFKSNPRYAGCVSKDHLPHDLDSKFVIVNLEDSTKGDGTHWVLLYNCDPGSVKYFDPVGEVPPVVIARYMNTTHKKSSINKTDLQPLGTSSCGWWCIFAAKMFLAGQSLPQVLSHFSSNPHANNLLLIHCFHH